MASNIFISKQHKIDFRNVVFNDARDGNLCRLKVFLDNKTKEEIAALVSSRTNGATPLVMACRNGHLDVAVYLLEKCNADIEQVGSVTFDGETIEGAPPLWCAAAAGHLNVVKTLIKFNASVNSTTKTNSTPLRAACFDGHFEIAKYLVEHGADIEIANRHGHTCLMIACYKGHYEISKYLLECGADVNRKSVKGNTALHDCAESGSLDILKMLLQHGARFNYDSSGTTPLLSAAVIGHVDIVEYFLHEYHCSKLEKINAVELLGATFMDKKRDMVMALECWRRAMALRYEDPHCPIEKPETKSPIAAYIDITEVRTLAQLNELITDPDKVRMQALLIRERILGPGHPDTAYYVRYRGAAYADNGNFDRCIKLWMYALDVQQKVLEPLSPMTQSSFLSFAELFSYMMSEAWARARGFPVVHFRDLLNVFQRALGEIEAALESSQNGGKDLNGTSQFHRTLIIAMHLVGLMCRLQPLLTVDEDLELKRSVYKLVRMNPRSRNGWTPLHLACFKDSSLIGRYPVFTFPSPEVVDLLLEVGACPNAVDYDHNTPLHVAAMNNPFAKAVFKALLNHGAHLDLANSKRKTPLHLAQDTSRLDIYPLKYINLQCICAQVIRKSGIPYKGLVHKKLEAFLDAH
ncbi:protein fem-1 homolog C-like [Stegodyphus dumicola]|uniref:protein fem-1 homolog C-like n=1 Tax=Stegodyphus dumicola TaxID=202533 RepID=UPI0015A7D7A8|nr:protein fem-1 homolog C-like [Stegodyphus dumicola]